MSDIRFRSDHTVEVIQSMMSDQSVARSAWVSSGTDIANLEDEKRVGGLINFLIRDRHGSCFENNSITFRIETPIFVAREVFRHRIASYNEMSGRYTILKPTFYIPKNDRPLVQVGKPGAYTFEQGTESQHIDTTYALIDTAEIAWEHYENLLNRGIGKEVARMVLPLNIYTEFYMTLNARSLMNFLSLRTQDKSSRYPSFPQYEIQQVANQMEEKFAELMPITHAHWHKHGRVAP